MGSKRFLNDPRVASLNVGDVHFEQDFTDAMLLSNNKEVQSSGFGGAGGKKVGTEGCLTKHQLEHNVAILMDFYSFMSDSTVQEGRLVHFHLWQLIITRTVKARSKTALCHGWMR